jgi:hypothetical protein
MPEQGEQDDDGQGNAEQEKKDASTHGGLQVVKY